MSSSTVISMMEECAEMVAPAMAPITDAVAGSPIVNCDETDTRAVIEVEMKTGSEDCSDDGTEPVTESVSRNV